MNVKRAPERPRISSRKSWRVSRTAQKAENRSGDALWPTQPVDDLTQLDPVMADGKPTSADTITNGAAAKAPKTPEEIAKEYDLLPRLIPHLDRHLIFPLLEFLSGQEDEASSDVIKAKYELLKPTNMSDYVANLWMEMNDSDSPPEEFAKKREEVLQRLALYAEETSKLTKLLDDDEVTGSLRSDKLANLKFLEEKHGVSILEVFLWDFAHLEIGDCQ